MIEFVPFIGMLIQRVVVYPICNHTVLWTDQKSVVWLFPNLDGSGRTILGLLDIVLFPKMFRHPWCEVITKRAIAAAEKKKK